MIKKEVIIGDCRLLLGDCMDILPTLGKVDACVTDPPYGIGAGNNPRWGVGAAITESKTYKTTFDDSNPCSDALIDLIRSISEHQIIWGGNYFTLPKTSCWFVWDKVTGDNLYADFEMAWTNLPRACRKIIWQWKGMLQQDMKNKEERVHPTQKPIEVMRWCLSFLPNAETILDPFMGSGTTLVACAKMGRKGIGIELDEDYFEIACRRVEQAYAQPDLFIEPPAKQVQHGLDL